jgi:beta-phosphoglucomutase
MKSNYKAFIFDLDGVLVSTETNHYLAWKAIADELGVPFSEHENESLKGVSRIESLKIILSLGNVELSSQAFDELLIKKNNIYLASIESLDQSNLLLGVKQLLVDAKAAGIKLALGSSSKNARFILDKLTISHLFDVVIDGNDVMNPKPNPEVFLKGAKALNFHPSECLVFEDAQSGLEAAINGGFHAVAVGNPMLKNTAPMYLNDLTEYRIN